MAYVNKKLADITTNELLEFINLVASPLQAIVRELRLLGLNGACGTDMGALEIIGLEIKNLSNKICSREDVEEAMDRLDELERTLGSADRAKEKP